MTTTAIQTQPLLSTKERWNEAVREVRKSGVSIKQNVRSCCRSCIIPNDVFTNIDDLVDPYAYSFGGQGNATKWVDDVMVPATVSRWQTRKPTDLVYFSHENGAARVLNDVFTRYGFTVEWNGSEDQCVMVHPNS